MINPTPSEYVYVGYKGKFYPNTGKAYMGEGNKKLAAIIQMWLGIDVFIYVNNHASPQNLGLFILFIYSTMYLLN